VALASFNFSKQVSPTSQNKFSLSFILPSTQLSTYFALNPIVQARVPLIIKRFRATSKKVSTTLMGRGLARAAHPPCPILDVAAPAENRAGPALAGHHRPG